MNLKILFTGILSSIDVIPNSQITLSNWGDWQDIDDYASYRFRILHFNSFNQKYSYEFGLQNLSNSEMQVSIAIAPEGEIPNRVDYRLSYVGAGASRVISPMFCSTGPSEIVKVWWTNLHYK